MRKLLTRIWDSPTFTTWGSFASRTLNLVLVLPLVLRQFSPAEVALWQVFASLIGLQILVDAGFGVTFSRLVAYAMGGVASLRMSSQNEEVSRDAGPNWALLDRILATTRLIYTRLSWILCTVLLLGGTPVLFKRFQALEDVANGAGQLTTIFEANIAWAVIIVSTAVSFRSNSYAVFLQGTNHVALMRRWEAFFGLGSIVTSMTVLLSGGGLLGLMTSNQLWLIVSAWRNRRLARHVFKGRFRDLPAAAMHSDVYAAAWGPAWRAAVGTFMASGLIHISGLIYAQSHDSVGVASYLLALRLLQTVSQMSQAPFYSKLPLLARLWAQGRVREQVALAERGMAYSHWSFVLPFVAFQLSGQSLMNLIGSQTPFPSLPLWGLLGAALFCERYGAMHLQLYSTSNHILWHITAGISGAIFIVVASALYSNLGVLSLPIGMLAGNIGFYTWYSARLSYRRFNLLWPWFDLRTVGVPSLLLTFSFIYAYQQAPS